MHSPRQKKHRRESAGPNPGWPTHSQAGNAYPPGLEPYVIDYPPEPNSMLRPIDPEKLARPATNGIVTSEYRYHPPGDTWPHFKVRHAPRSPNQTDEQWEFCVQDTERYTLQFAVYLRFCQMLATHLGNFRTCTQGECRRRGVCCGMRDQDRYTLPILIYPPCVPLDLEIMETYRQEINREMTRVEEEG